MQENILTIPLGGEGKNTLSIVALDSDGPDPYKVY